MIDNFYKHSIKNAPFGFAYHKIITNDLGKPIDYEFLEINDGFEKMTGIKSSAILNRKVTEVFPDIQKDNFDWIGFYGDVALNDGKKEFEQYSSILERWYKVQAYSPEKYYFIAIFIDISQEKEKSLELENFFTINLDLLCIANLNGYFLKTNQAWEDIL